MEIKDMCQGLQIIAGMFYLLSLCEKALFNILRSRRCHEVTEVNNM
jgi:hypothetical protein